MFILGSAWESAIGMGARQLYRADNTFPTDLPVLLLSARCGCSTDTPQNPLTYRTAQWPPLPKRHLPLTQYKGQA